MGEASGGPGTPQEYAAKVDGLAATITKLAPDVLAVQEVGSPDALEDLVAKLGEGWHHALADPDRRGIRVGFLSRLPITTTEQIPG